MMDRGRGGGRGRATKKQRAGHPPSQQPYPESIHTTGPSFTSSQLALSHKVPQTAPQRGNKSRPVNQTPHRASSPTGTAPVPTTSENHSLRGVTPRTDKPGRSNTFHSSFTFESPTNHGITPDAPSARRRAKTFETTTAASFDGDDEAHSKGGHSLRKRTRIDYTQVIDDEIGLAAARNGAEMAPRATAAGPSIARSRKRKGGHSQDDTDDDDVSSTTKRRRAEKSPAAPRAASRRRNNNKKLPTGMSAYIDQPSDNDAVQDTILVGVSMDGDEETEQSSYRESDSAPSSPEGSNPARRQAQHQPPMPSQQREGTPTVSQPGAVGLENGDHIPQKLVPSANEVNHEVNSNEQTMDLSPDHAPETAPNSAQPQDRILLEQSGQEQHNNEQQHNVPSSLDSNVAHLQQIENLESVSEVSIPTKSSQPHMETSVALSQLSESSQPTSTEDTPLIPSSPTPEPPVSEPPQQQQQQQQQQAPPSPSPLEPSAREAPAVESAPGQVDGADEPESSAVLDVDSPQPQLPATTAISSRPILRVPKPMGPVRLPRLERIYEAETPFASALNLEPYEDEDVALPGPYTEWVYPEEAPPTPTPIPTPTPTPVPMDNITPEVTWNVTRKLKRREFDALYRQESKRRREKGVSPISMAEFHNECVRLYRAAIKTQGQGQLTPVPPKQVLEDAVGASKKTQPDSDALDSPFPTAAPSPAAEDDGQLDGVDDQQELDDDLDPEQDETQVPERQTRRAVDPIEVTKNYSKQYLFPKIRDPAEFASLLENPEDLDREALINYTAAAVEALHAYQQEYHELKKIIDDEENAKRRQANDKTIANWENRQKDDEPLPWRRHYDEPIKGPPPFELRGARAPKPYVDDQYLDYQREQDRIMAQAYGFKHNNHVSLIGRQNPEEQRWEAPETRLRERKRTEKAAELAEDNVVEGKRTRRPRQVADQSKEASRAGTPALGVVPTRRQRKIATTAAAANGDLVESVDPAPVAETTTESPRKQRAAAAAARARQIADEESASSATPQDSSQGDEDYQAAEPAKARKRNRPAIVDTSSPAPASEAIKPAIKNKRPNRAPTSAPTSTTTEIATSSFYSNPAAASSQPESRPSTASSDRSDRTAETAESAYSLRDKRKRNFALENDPELEPRPQRRRVPQKSMNSMPEPKASTKKPRQPRQSPLSQLPPAPPVPAPPAPPVEPTLPPLSIAPQPVVPPPPPSGGLKAPTLIYNSSAVPPSAPVLAPAKPSGQPPGPFLHTFNSAPAFQHGIPPPPAAPPAIKKPITRIKLTNTTGLVKGRPIGKGSRGGGKPGGSTLNAEGKLPTLTELQAEAPEKSYSEMSKSEKMSYSMRRRWASGEMQGAVEKRRTTLANKKAEKAIGRPGEDSAPGSANHSGASTPQPQPQMLPQPPQAPPPAHIQHQLQNHPPAMPMMMVPGPLALPGGHPPPPHPQGPGGLVQPRTLQPPPAMQHPQPWGPPIVPGQGGQMVFSFPSAPHPLHGHPGHPGPMN